MKQFILSILLISGIAQASAEDDGRMGGRYVPVAPAAPSSLRTSAVGGAGGASVSDVGYVPSVVVAARPSTAVVSAGATVGRGSGSASGSIRAPLRAYPPIAIGHEADYDRFLNGVLTYKPNKDNDIGLVYLCIRDLVNPLDGTFDLSKCGDTGKYVSIHTGYKTATIPANRYKVEIWLTPKFLVEGNLGGDAAWMRGVMSQWEASYGIVWTWGNNPVVTDSFDYLLAGDVLLNKDKNLYEKWRTIPRRRFPPLKPGICKQFILTLSLENDKLDEK
ncbi:MAG: hypothetical protein FJX18_06040 [Alphaproteobacteria bacterium]|nr:hypothetical protein [Alphaproteobacteria bacterium]